MARKMCERCTTKRAVGGVKKFNMPEKMAALCIDCITADFVSGKCAACGFGLTTKSHKNLCAPLDEVATPELEATAAT